MGKDEKEVMKVGGPGEDILTIQTPEDVIAIAEKRSGLLIRFKQLSIKHTNRHDWVDQGGKAGQAGKPYLTSSGAEKIARLFGVKIHSINYSKRTMTDDKGSYYIYEYNGVAELPSKFDSIEAVGTCTSRDVFFAKKGGEYKKLSEVDESNIMKAAYSNFVVNAITRLLGIRSMTWEEVEAGASFKKTDVQRVEYANGAQSGQYLVSEAQCKRLYAISKEAKVDADTIKKHLKKNYGIDSSKEIKREFYDDIVSWVQEQGRASRGGK